MSPEDPRHGTQAGYRAHRKAGQDACDACKRGAAATEAYNLYRRRKGLTGRINPIGSQRRLQALAALGYDWKSLGARLGMTGTGIARLAQESGYMHPATVRKIAALYEELSMTLPPLDTPHRRNAATRARGRAAAAGWPPPLALDDDRIDDPTYQPRDWHYTSPSRAEALRDLASLGVGITEACTRLHLSREALEKWCARHQMSDVYRELAGRETPIREYRNQFSEGAA